MTLATSSETSEIPAPPDELAEVVGGPLSIGAGHLAELRARGLRPDEDVLDVGCGIGRTAIPLTGYLSEEGSYRGFDISQEAIAWCTREITSRYPSFRFTYVDICNAAYNPEGTVRAAEFTFPYADDSFDLVFLYSIFTHLLPEDFERYCSEIARVLRHDGRCLASFFVLTDERLRTMAEAVAADPDGVGVIAQSLVARDVGPYSAGHPVAEWLVAYQEAFVREIYGKYGLSVEEPVWWGQWVEWAIGNASVMGPQDVVIANAVVSPWPARRSPQHVFARRGAALPA